MGREKKTDKSKRTENVIPLLKTVEQMSRLCGIGENRLRKLMDNGEIEYLQNGNRRLLTDAAILDWYERAKTPVRTNVGGNC